MNLVTIGTMMLRILSIGWFLGVIEAATYLPADIIGVAYHHGIGYFADQYIIDLVARAFRVVIDLVAGYLFLFRAEKLARWACKGLEGFAAVPVPGMWPPAPTPETLRVDEQPSVPLS